MKKKYEKPRIMFEDMEFYSAIAACNVALDPEGNLEYIQEVGSGTIFFTVPGLCEVPADEEHILCYHNPDGSYDGMVHSKS